MTDDQRDAARWRKISALMVGVRFSGGLAWQTAVNLVGDSPEEAIDHYGEPTTANPYKMSEDERLDSEQHGQGDK